MRRLNIIQRTMVLLGNANEMIRLLNIFKYGQKPQPTSGKFLFDSGFIKHTQGEVETDSSLAEIIYVWSRCHHPYSNLQQLTQEPVF